jgi:hypothetical protein
LDESSPVVVVHFAVVVAAAVADATGMMLLLVLSSHTPNRNSLLQSADAATGPQFGKLSVFNAVDVDINTLSTNN